MIQVLASLLLPSWRFFEEAGESYSIEFSTLDPQKGWSPWLAQIGFWTPPNQRNILEFFFAPKETLRLWKVVQLNRFVHQLQVVELESPELQNELREIQILLLEEIHSLRTPKLNKWRFSIVGSKSGRIFESGPFPFSRPA